MVILSGLVTPVYNMPEILQILTYADPLRFAVEYVHGVYLENLSISELWGQIIPMLITAVVTLQRSSSVGPFDENCLLSNVTDVALSLFNYSN